MSNGLLNNIRISEQEEMCKLLKDIVSYDGETKQGALRGFRSLEGNVEFLINLTEIVLTTSFRSDVRILASTELKKHVEVHWCSTVPNFIAPEINIRIKSKIKELLLIGLLEPVPKVRKAIADIIVTIVPWDWPDNWPELFDKLIQTLNEDSECAIRGALQVLHKFIDQLKVIHVQNVSTVIMREMNRILRTETRYSIQVRCHAVKVFSSVILKTVQYKRPDLIQQFIQPEILIFYQSLLTNWMPLDNKILKVEYLKTFKMLLDKLPKCIADFLPNALPLVWESLINCAEDYRVNIVNVFGSNDCDTEFLATVDLVNATFSFVKRLMHGNSSTHVSPLLACEWFYLQDSFIPPHAFHHLISLLEITDSQIELWSNNVYEFVKKEELQYYHTDGIRRATEDLLAIMPDHNERTLTNGLIVVIMKHLQGENAKRANGQAGFGQNSWKTHEAYLLAFCLMKSAIVSKKRSESQCYDIVPLLENVILADLNNRESHPLLIGRCLCVGGFYRDQMSPGLTSSFLKATVKYLQSDQPSCVRVCAAKSVFSWYYGSGKSNKEIKKLLATDGPLLLEGLCDLAENFISAEVLTLTLKSIAFVVPMVPNVPSVIASRIYSLVLAALLDCRTKYPIYRPWMNVIQELMLHPQSYTSLQQRLTPILLRMMSVNPSDTLSDDTVALDILQVLVQNSRPTLSKLLIDNLFPALCNYIVKIDTTKIRVSGIDVIHTYLTKSPQQVVDYRDKNGKKGVQYVIDAVVHTLTSKSTKSQIEDACDILPLLMRKTGSKLEGNIDPLLKALLNTITSKSVTRISRKLLMIYAHLLNSRFNTVFSFLANASSPSGQPSPLECVVSEGFCRGYNTFQGEDRKSVKLALGKILEHGVTNQYSRLHQITFKDENTQGGTTKPIPLLLKICKLTITDLP